VGFDHWSFPTDLFFTGGAVSTSGTIVTAPGQGVTAIRDVTNNTGYLAQAQFGVRDMLFLTAGVRAEQNTNFGDDLGTPVSPRVGLSYVRQVGGATLKFRGSWGRAIRAPAPGLKLGAVSAGSVTLPNLALGPERQQGWDLGVDATFGSRATISATYYDQVADGLIQQVILPGDSVLTFQSQNVGRVGNDGVEIEGKLSLGRVRLQAQYGYARSEVERLAVTYTGDLRVGEQSQLTPKHTAGASVSSSLGGGTTVAAGLTYVGSWTYYDVVAYFRCLGQTGPCRNDTFALDRDYLVEFPGFAKINASVVQRITPLVSGFLAIDNLTDNDAQEYINFNPVIGRITTVGLSFRY
jgi:outer membrane receptor protein involved in Fe transport